MSPLALHGGFTIGAAAPVALATVEQSDALLNGAQLTARARRMVEIYKLMGDSHRLLIASLIHAESTHVTGMTDVMDESQPAVSHHLAIYKKAGVLEDQKDGRWRRYEFTRTGKADMQKASTALLGIEPLPVSGDEPLEGDEEEAAFEISDLHAKSEQTPLGITVVDTMRILGEEMRFNILLRLSGGEMHVSQICDEVQHGQPAVSHHLAKMREEVKLLQKHRKGKHNFYSVSPENGMPLLRSAARVLQFFAKGPQKTEQTKPE